MRSLFLHLFLQVEAELVSLVSLHLFSVFFLPVSPSFLSRSLSRSHSLSFSSLSRSFLLVLFFVLVLFLSRSLCSLSLCLIFAFSSLTNVCYCSPLYPSSRLIVMRFSVSSAISYVKHDAYVAQRKQLTLHRRVCTSVQRIGLSQNYLTMLFSLIC